MMYIKVILSHNFILRERFSLTKSRAKDIIAVNSILHEDAVIGLPSEKQEI